jgi:hypothetical protein
MTSGAAEATLAIVVNATSAAERVVSFIQELPFMVVRILP